MNKLKFHFFRNMVRVRVVFKHDSDAPEMNTIGDEISRVLRTRNSNGDGSRRNSVCVGGSLEEIAEEEEEFMFRFGNISNVGKCDSIKNFLSELCHPFSYVYFITNQFL